MFVSSPPQPQPTFSISNPYSRLFLWILIQDFKSSKILSYNTYNTPILFYYFKHSFQYTINQLSPTFQLLLSTQPNTLSRHFQFTLSSSHFQFTHSPLKHNFQYTTNHLYTFSKSYFIKSDNLYTPKYIHNSNVPFTIHRIYLLDLKFTPIQKTNIP